jgi:hypothetical protein
MLSNLGGFFFKFTNRNLLNKVSTFKAKERDVSSWIKFSPLLEKYFISFIQRMEIFPYFFRENFTRGKLNDRENKNKFP